MLSAAKVVPCCLVCQKVGGKEKKVFQLQKTEHWSSSAFWFYAHPDWIFLLDPQVQLSIYSRNALTDTPRNNALPVIWVSPDPVKLTYKINHCTPCCPLPNLLHLRQELRTQKQSLKPSEEKALPLILPHLLGFRFQVSVCRKAQQDAGESVPTKAWLQQDHEGQEMR
jgi:hypothetical protein